MAAALGFAAAAQDTVGASHANGMQAMSIDMDTSGNTATSLGPLDSCRSVTPPAVFDIDVTALDIPATAFGGMNAFAFTLHYDNTAGAQSVTAQNPSLLLAANPGSAIFNGSDATPDADGAYTAAAFDSGPVPATSEVGSGVLSRITLSVGAGATPGAYPLTLTDVAHVDGGGFPYPPDTINNAFLVVDGSCDDLDADGIPNAEDACPTIQGPGSNAGCPLPGPPAVGGALGLLDNRAAPTAVTQESETALKIAALAIGGLLLLGAGAVVRRRLIR
jgi:hypothetical protein